MSEKTIQISKSDFLQHAKGHVVTIMGNPMIATPRQMSTGSLGWHAGGKIIVDIEGTPVNCQVGLNITVIGSKE